MLFLSKKKMSTEHPEDMIPITKNDQNKNTDILFQEITHHKNAKLGHLNLTRNNDCFA